MDNQEIETVLRSTIALLDQIAKATAGFLEMGLGGPFVGNELAKQRNEARSIRENLQKLHVAIGQPHTNPSEV